MADPQKPVAQQSKPQPAAPAGQQPATQPAPRAAVMVSGGKLRLQVQQSVSGQGGVAIGLFIDDGQGNPLVSWHFDGQETNFETAIPFQELTLGVQPTP